MNVSVASIESGLFRTRNFIFLAAVIAMNYTLIRPSPVDLLFVLAMVVSLAVKQEMTRKFLVLTMILTVWAGSFVLASIPNLGEGASAGTTLAFSGALETENARLDRGVGFQLLIKVYVVILGLIGAFVAMSWSERHFLTFMRVYIVSAVIASVLGTIGFVLKIDLLTWDDRARGLFDDPNMYGAFLIPAVIFCAHLLRDPGRQRLLAAIAMPIVGLGILLSFSRIAIVATLVVLAAYATFLNRLRLHRLIPALLGLVVFAIALFALAYMTSDEFSQKFLQRLTLVESYDAGREGRYGRYLLVLPMILDNPMGFGVLQLERIFPEPIHNIWLSSFVNYGWSGGFTWIVLFFASVGISVQSYLRTRNLVPVTLLMSLVGIVMCVSLHEGEQWRHLWLFYGLVWGFNARNFLAPAEAATKRADHAQLPASAPRPIANTVGGIPRAPLRPRRTIPAIERARVVAAQ